MKKIIIASVIALIFVSLVGSYGKKRRMAGTSRTQAIDSSNPQPQNAPTSAKAPKETTGEQPASAELPTEPDPEPEPPRQSADVTERILGDIAESKMRENAVVLGEAVQSLTEICSTAVNTQKALLSIDLNRDANSNAESESEKEKANELR